MPTLKGVLSGVLSGVVSIAILMVSAAAGAENTITVVSTFLKSGQSIPQVCRAPVEVWRKLILQYPHTTSWRWVVLCDDNAWNLYLQRSGQDTDDQNIYASTDIDAGLTYLRGTSLTSPDSPDALPAHVIAHELAHIVLHSRDEIAVEAQALKWLRQQKQSPGSLVSSNAVTRSDGAGN